MEMTVKIQNFDFTISDGDVVGLSDWIPQGEFNPHNVRPWLLHDAGFTLAIVFADCLQDAIDEAVDAGRLDRFKITEDERGDYSNEAGDDWNDSVSFLGNAGEPFDIETLGAVELPNPRVSFIAQLKVWADEASAATIKRGDNAAR